MESLKTRVKNVINNRPDKHGQGFITIPEICEHLDITKIDEHIEVIDIVHGLISTNEVEQYGGTHTMVLGYRTVE